MSGVRGGPLPFAPHTAARDGVHRLNRSGALPQGQGSAVASRDLRSASSAPRQSLGGAVGFGGTIGFGTVDRIDDDGHVLLIEQGAVVCELDAPGEAALGSRAARVHAQGSSALLLWSLDRS